MSLPCSRLQARPDERAPAPGVTVDLRRLLADAAVSDAEKRGRGCARPVRLVGSTRVVNKSTSEVGHRYSSSQELDGTTYVRCGNRRAEVCPSCSAEYKWDAWHLSLCGLAGGKGIPASVANHPCTFATFTAPSFGPVQGVRQKGPCRGSEPLPLPASAVALLRRRFMTGARLDQPVFPSVDGGFRDPANVRRELRQARGEDALAWSTSRSARKTAATILDEAALSARLFADPLGHSRPSMTQDVHLGRWTPRRRWRWRPR